ncbi:MAG: 6-bladed beta-propeller [Ignavibacteriae bacterium]|nr:6-bladed beta-propeller [Ignavibacteriota bacterium]
MMKTLLTYSILILFIAGGLNAQTDSERQVWPSPPDRARIKHVLTISSFESFESKRDFFSDVFTFIFGSEQTSNWLVQPVGIAVSSSGKIYVADPGASGVHIIDQKEKEYDFIYETDEGNFRSPVGCAVSDDGIIFISDSERGDILALDDDYDVEFQIKDHLVRPTGIQIHGERLYVTDTGQHKIIVFALDGKYITEFGQRGDAAGEFNYPVQLATRDSLFILDAVNYRVQKFSFSGAFSSMFGRQGNVSGRFASPKAIALDSDGNMYITDALMDNFQIFNNKNELLLVVGKKGTGDGEFMTPNGIAIDQEDKIYVLDSLNRRIQIFQYLK